MLYTTFRLAKEAGACDAACDAARAASWAAACDAARDAERDWQEERFLQYLNGGIV